MREILFRGKRVSNGKWVKGYLLYDDLSDVAAIVSYVNLGDNVRDLSEVNISEIVPETLGQYTGLNDKSDTKIFEGDKVRLPIEDDEIIGIIKWDDYMAKFIADVDDGFLIYPLSKRHAEKLEVIGNIHDNPELIGG